MLLLEVIFHPRNKMIFEGTLDHLMKKVTREYFVNVGTRKVARERLTNGLR